MGVEWDGMGRGFAAPWRKLRAMGAFSLRQGQAAPGAQDFSLDAKCENSTGYFSHPLGILASSPRAFPDGMAQYA